jgi:hypothetical protein
MKRPTLVFTRPWHWVDYGSDRLKLVYVPIGGDFPRRKNGKPAGDGVGQVATVEGIQKLREAFRQHRPEFFLYWVHFRLGLDEMERLKNISPDTRFICGYGNQPHKISGHVRKFKAYIDTILLNSRDPANYQKYRDFGIPHVGTLHDGFDPLEWVPTDKPRKYDVFFGGNQAYAGSWPHVKWKYPLSRFRYELLCEVHKKFKLHVRGNAKLPFAVRSYLWYPEYSKEFQTAKIMLGSPHYDLQQYYSRRTIHAGACGRAFLTRYIPGMEEDFGPNHTCAAWFTEIDECLDLMDFYLKHDAVRERMEQRCRKVFLRDHTWEARLREMEDIAESLL